jgi:hypothetical protein
LLHPVESFEKFFFLTSFSLLHHPTILCAAPC